MELKEGYIKDFISGSAVRATPEEVEAVQVFSRMLVDDYGYPRALIQTRPQWRVKVRPSDTKKEYPVDIAVFSGKKNIKMTIFKSLLNAKNPPEKTDVPNLRITCDFPLHGSAYGLMAIKNFF